MDNMELGIDEIKRRIREREILGKPVGKLKAALSVKNRSLNRTKSTTQIRQEIINREAEGKPTGQLQDELRSRER